MTHKPQLCWLAGCIVTMSLCACGGEQGSWADHCLEKTRATREFCECLDERRVVREGKIVVGGGGRLRTGGRIEAPVLEEPDIEDEKVCRAQIIERIERETPLN